MVRLHRWAPRTERTAAAYLAERLLRALDGPPERLSTWRRAAASLGVRAHEYHAPGASRGEFAASPPDGEPAVIAINTAYPERDACRAYAHELAHVLLHRMQPPLLPGFADAGRYEGEPADRHHRIARTVERITLPQRQEEKEKK